MASRHYRSKVAVARTVMLTKGVSSVWRERPCCRTDMATSEAGSRGAAPRPLPDLREDVSTSESDNDSTLDGAVPASGDHSAHANEDDDMGAEGASSPADRSFAPDLDQVRCMWEDCGESFSDLHPFIDHLHSCKCEADSTADGRSHRHQ